MALSQHELHPAENRGYRELYAASQQIVAHWSRLAEWIGEPDSTALTSGVDTSRELAVALNSRIGEYGLTGGPAAAGVGRNIGALRRTVADRFLERNQALRSALLDAQHVSALLAYLGKLAEQRKDTVLETFCQSWRERFSETEADLWLTAVNSGFDPDLAVARLDDSLVGKTAHGAAYAVGAVGEWVDRRAGKLAGAWSGGKTED